MRTLLLSVLTLLAAVQVVRSQTKTVVAPTGYNYATTPGEAGYFVAPGYQHVLEVFDQNRLGFGPASILELAYRRYADWPMNFPAQTIKATVRLGYTRHTLTGLPYRFSKVAFAAVEVFKGSLNLPAAPFRYKALPPWSVMIKLKAPFLFIPAVGRLVVDNEFESPTTSPSWIADAHYDKTWTGTPGLWTAKGRGCDSNKSPLYPMQQFTLTTTKDEKLAITPGSSAMFGLAYLPPPATFGFHVFGPFLSQPIDLTPIGAPNCWIYVYPWFTLTPWPVVQLGSRQRFAVAEYSVPNNPNLVGATFGSQWLAPDLANNPLGLAVSGGAEIRLGAAPKQSVGVKTLVTDVKGSDYGMMVVWGTGRITRFTVR